MPEREQLSGVDNAWRRMGTTNNLMTITGLLMFEETVTYEEVCDRLEERLLRFERFTQRVDGRKRTVRRPHWQTVEDMNIEDHVYDLSLPEPNDKESFQRFVGTLMSRPVDERRPLWEAFILDGAGPNNGNAVVFRINHSIGDGFALMHVMLGLVDNPDELEFPIGGISAPPRPDLEDDSAGSSPDEASAAADGGAQAVQPDVEDEGDTGGVEKLREETSSSTWLDSVKLGAKGLRAGYNLVSMRGEPETSLFGDLGPTKRAAWTDRVDLEDVKAVGDAHDATINEVLLATTAGAIRRVLDARGEDTRELTLHCTMPVNLRPMEERPESLGNYFGITFVPIPVGTRDLGERIELVNSQIDLQTAGIEAYLMYQLLNLGGIVPEQLQQLIMRFFEKHATGIVTNVPGPLNTAEFAGKEVSDLIFWVPQGNNQGLGISIISYNSKVRVGIASDANLLPDPTEMTDAFEDELAMLVEQVD
jgi:diacylglycerol O-acyltransferase